jgi:uncharacterized SAM-binding protein YcdF (DUF218 family)
MAWASLLLLLLFGNSVLFNEAALLWEGSSVDEPLSVRDSNAVAVVLGGYSLWDPVRKRGQLTEAGDRLYGGLTLYHRGLVGKILISGGSGDLFRKQRSEAEFVQNMLCDAGVRPDRILAEPASRNTFENALYSKKLIDSLRLPGPFYLVTSAAHMPRSLGCFRKAGLQVQPVRVHYLSKAGRGYTFQDWVLPNASCLYLWEALIKEWIGIMSYRLSGKQG